MVLARERKLSAASAESPSETADENLSLEENQGVAIAKSVQLSMEKRNFRRQDDRSDKEKKESLQNRQKTTQHAQDDEHPTQGMPDNFIRKFFFH